MRSNADKVTDNKILLYAVLAANFFPRIIKPISNRIMLAIKEKSPAEIGHNLATKTARPVIPPKVKLLANLKK